VLALGLGERVAVEQNFVLNQPYHNIGSSTMHLVSLSTTECCTENNSFSSEQARRVHDPLPVFPKVAACLKVLGEGFPLPRPTLECVRGEVGAHISIPVWL
jgi:hypothetical protein